jgi:hypothetical protein
MRIAELRKLDTMPDKVLVDLLCTNNFPISIDEEGYLCIALSKPALSELIYATVNNTLSVKQDDNLKLLYLLNQVICEEVGKLIEDVKLKLTLKSSNG